MSNKALDYAEKNLGVHEVYEDVQRNLNDLDTLYSDLDKAQDRKRQLNEDIADREAELIGEKRGTHADMSDTGFRTRMKEWERSDTKLAELRGQLNSALGEIQGLEYDADLLKLKIKTGSARLEELGGYLHYLAAVKAAARPAQAEKTTKPKE